MKIMSEIAEVIGFFVPDFLALGVGASVFLGVYCGVTTLSFFETHVGNSGLLAFSLLLAYVAAVAFNVASSVASPPSATVSPAIPRRPRFGHCSVTALELQRFRAPHSRGTPAKDADPRFSE